MIPAGRKLNLALVGCGKMGSAMLHGWLSSGILSRCDILDPTAPLSDPAFLQDIVSFEKEARFFKPSASWDILVLAIKPQIFTEVCASIRDVVPPSLPILSIAAGKTTDSIRAAFSPVQPVIRAMPNTPASIGRGVSGVFATDNVSITAKDMVNGVLSPLGLVEWVGDEGLMDAITALSGSGPAYVFLLIETMAKAGENAGLPADLALRLARQTVTGCAALADRDPLKSPANIRKDVTSPGGTTEAALNVLMDGRFQSVMDLAIEKAVERARALSR